MFKQKSNKSEKNRRDWVNLSSFPTKPASILRRVSWITPVTTSAAGQSNGIVNNGTIRTNATEWSQLQARYQEYRVLRLKAKVVQAATLNAGRIVFLTDRTGSAAVPASENAAWADEQAKVFNLENLRERPIVYESTAADLEDQNFQATTASNATFGMGYYVTSTISTTVCAIMFEALVEFKGNS